MVDINIIREECFLDEILTELPNRVAQPTPAVKGKNLKKFFHQFSDSLKDVDLQYTCVDTSSVAIALGTNIGNAYLYQRIHKKIVKVSSETKFVPATCIKLACGCTTVAFGHETGTFSVGLVDPPIHKSFDSLTAKDVHHESITCLEWSSDGQILYTGDSSGKISMSVVKISEAILQTAVIVTEDCSVVQLSYAADALLISTLKRTLIWPFQTEALVQVGEKERKTSGGFGCCFMPDTLQEPTKKLYTARPGLRIWTADASGKVSSTSAFKTLLSDKPAVIRTLTGNDGKVNSGGQFGQLLVYHNQYITTWDQSHVWVLDLDIGNVIGCLSNLGKIRDVAVCGHEIFVLVNQRERFLRRFILATERVLDSSCLDAVVAGAEEPEETPQESSQGAGFNITSALMKVPFMALESEESGSGPQSVDAVDPEIANKVVDEADGPPKKDIFDKIASIPLEGGQGDIVFTAVKKKKKKKKPKQATASAQVEEADTASDTQSKIEASKDPESPALSRSSHEITQHAEVTKTTTTAEEGIGRDMESGSNPQTTPPIQTKPHEGFPRTVVLDKEPETSSAVPELNSTQEGIKDMVTSQSVGEENQGLGTAQLSDAASTNDSSSVNEDSSLTENCISDEAKQEASVTSEGTPIPQQTLTANETHTAGETIPQETQAAQQTLAMVSEIPNIGNTSMEDPSTSRQDSSDSTDIYRSSDGISRSDSHEEDRDNSENRKETKEQNPKPTERDDHVPLHADTWSGRALPTSQTIEHLSISQRYIFCVDARGRVYISDPNTASCDGWEKVDFKAKQIYVTSNCDFICYVDQGKAFIRGNISAVNPVGNASFQVLDEVSLFTTCSSCTWALTAGDILRRADTAVLGKLRGNLKSSNSMWEYEDSHESLCQIVCHDNVVWGRTVDETLLVYSGRSSGKRTTWKTEDKKAKWASMSDDGTVWIITPDDEIWFKPHVTASYPTGEVWYQVTLGQYIIDDSSILDSTFNFFYSVGSAYRSARTTEYLRNAAKGLLQSTKDMAFSLFKDGGSPKQIYCNMQSGVWLLDTRNALHACRGHATGAFWENVCPTGTAKSATWRDVTTGLAGYVWAIQPNGDLTCFHPKGPAFNVVCPASQHNIDFMSGSPHGLWCFVTEDNSKLYIRDGISESYPQGFAWTTLPLSHQDINNIRHLSIGGITVWAVDNNGHVWVRIGSLNGDESTALAQAWLPLDCPENTEFACVVVNGRDSMVWAVDTKGSVYARDGVREDFLVGAQWREVEGVTLKNVCLSSYLVYGLCTTGEIVCRFGVSEMNCIGDYWKKIPGNFPQISVNSAGELWAISAEEKLYARKMRCLEFSRGVGREEEGEGGVVGDGSHGDGAEVDADGEADWELL